jgi:hypothetical protein
MWIRIGMALLAAASSSACTSGVGEPCARSVDCEAGLACVGGACATCGDDVACVAVDLVVAGCDPASNPLDQVTQLRIRTEGEGMESRSVTVPVDARAGEVTGLSFGPRRRIVVEGLDASGGLPRSRGVSPEMDLSPDAPVPAVTVYLRRVESFSTLATTTNPPQCSGLNVARAGHTATELADGRVLVAGGHAFDADGSKTYLKSAELWDPKTGGFVVLPASMTAARTGHVASLLPDGKVLLTGGASRVNGAETALATAELFDPAAEKFTIVRMTMPRMRHTATVLPGGAVLVAGGASATVEERTLTDRMEVFSPSTKAFAEGPRLSSKRAFHAAVALDAERVMVLGGAETIGPGPLYGPAEALATVDVFRYLRESGTFVPETDGGYALAAKRPLPLAMAMDLGEGRVGVLVTGVGAPGSARWEWLAPAGVPAPALGEAPAARVDGCFVPTEGGALAVGGRSEDRTQLLDAAQLVAADTSGKLTTFPVGRLAEARARPSCTALRDGTVLVIGGETAAGGAVSARAEVYAPRP